MGRSKEGEGRRLEWKGRVKGRNCNIIIIVIIRRGRERISKGRELRRKGREGTMGKGRKVVVNKVNKKGTASLSVSSC